MFKCGLETEIFSRVTGYVRPVKNWNRGKREEFKERKTYSVESFAAPTHAHETKNKEEER